MIQIKMEWLHLDLILPFLFDCDSLETSENDMLLALLLFLKV